MTRTVPCPECHRPAHILDDFTVQRPSGSVGYLRVQCEGPLSFLVSVSEMDTDYPGLPAEPVDLMGGAA